MNPRQYAFEEHPHVHSNKRDIDTAQFVRRGVLYGDPEQSRLRWDNPDEAPTEKVGMLFMGYMTQIGAQFLKMLVNWVPGRDFPQKDSGADPLLGSGGAWDWSAHPELLDSKPLPLSRFVTSKGAAFFVVPPLCWLKTCT
jgi:hypothetical protein